jgi:hypothetical protein
VANILLPFVTTFDDKGVKSAQGSLVGLTKSYLSAGVVATSIGALMKSSITSASNLQETVNKSNVVFGNAADSVEKFANTASAKFGQSKQQALEAASTFALFGKSAGLAGEDLVGFSTDFVTLASDLASFNNTSPQDAIEAIGAALRGEAEPIRRYNVLLSDAVLKNRALEMKIYDGTGALTSQQKILATQAEIIAQSDDALGDFARTSDGFANTTKTLTAQLEDLSAAAGTQLLPVMEDLAVITSGVVGLFKTGEGEASKFGDGFVFLTKKLIPVVGVVQRIGDIIGFTADKIREAGSASIDSAGDFRKFEEQMKGKYNKTFKEANDLNLGLSKSTDKANDKAKKYSDTLRERVKKSLDTVNDQLKIAQEEFDGVRDSMTSTFMGFASLSEAFQTNANAITEEQDALKARSEAYTALDLAKQAGDTEDIARATLDLAEAEKAVNAATAKRSSTTTIGEFQKQIAAAKKFGENLQFLIGHGLQQAGLAQLLNLGPVAGVEVTNDMIGGGTGSFWKFQESMAQLSGIASGIGLATANAFMGGNLATATTNQQAVNQYSITVNAGLVSNPAQVGRDIIEAIKSAERVSGQVFVSV